MTEPVLTTSWGLTLSRSPGETTEECGFCGAGAWWTYAYATGETWRQLGKGYHCTVLCALRRLHLELGEIDQDNHHREPPLSAIE